MYQPKINVYSKQVSEEIPENLQVVRVQMSIANSFITSRRYCMVETASFQREKALPQSSESNFPVVRTISMTIDLFV